jgi:hypothetical protein
MYRYKIRSPHEAGHEVDSLSVFVLLFAEEILKKGSSERKYVVEIDLVSVFKRSLGV